MCYLYTDEIPPISADRCLNLLELANRLCLPRLLNLVECRVIEDLTRLSQNETGDAVELCLKLLEQLNCTMRISWLNGVCHICVSITIQFVSCLRKVFEVCIQKIKITCVNIVGHRFGI